MKNERMNRMRELDAHVRKKSAGSNSISPSMLPKYPRGHSRNTSKPLTGGSGIPMPPSLSSGTNKN